MLAGERATLTYRSSGPRPVRNAVELAEIFSELRSRGTPYALFWWGGKSSRMKNFVYDGRVHQPMCARRWSRSTTFCQTGPLRSVELNALHNTESPEILKIEEDYYERHPTALA